MLKGCDISSYQGIPDLYAVYTSVSFVIAKATEGVGYKDPSFDANAQALRSTDSLHSFYHFARPDLGNSAVDEANYFCSVIGTPEPGEILALDFEVNYSDPVNWCKAFLDTVSSKLNSVKPLIYLNLSLVKSHDWSPVISAGYGLWLADYDGISDNTVDTPWPVVAMKQYSSSGQVNGISGNVDLDTFFGDETAFKAYGYHALTSVPTNTGTPPIGPDVPLVLSDSQEINWGPSLGIQEVQATRSTLLDNIRDISNLKSQVYTLTQTVNDLTAKNQEQTTTIEDQGVEITKLQEQLNATQTVRTTPNPVSNTGNSTQYQIAPTALQMTPPPPSNASLLSKILSWIFRQ